MKTQLVIRDFAPADLDAVLALNMHAQNPDADIQASLRFYPELLDIPSHFQVPGAFLVGTLLGDVVAMGAITRVEGDLFEMDYVRVAIPQQRKGAGRAMVRALHDRARSLEARTIVLTTDADNVAARQLYEAEGYSSEGPTTVYDADGRAWHPVRYRREIETARG